MAEFRKSFSRPANLNEQKIKELYDRLEKKEDSETIQLRLKEYYDSLERKKIRANQTAYINHRNECHYSNSPLFHDLRFNSQMLMDFMVFR